MRVYQRLTIFATLIALLLFAGCGPNTTTSTIAQSTATGNSTRIVKTGSVTLHAGASFYRTSDTISVTLSNQSKQTIYFPDHLTNCTVILLQRQKVQPLAGESGQGGISPCKLEIATRMHSLGAGQSLVVRLVAPFNSWPPGFYRAILSYRTSLDTGPSTTISSAAFTVGPLVPQP